MLIEATDVLQADSGNVVAGASAQLLTANIERNGLSVSVDSAATAPVYLLLGTGVASATNWHVCLAAGGYWYGQLSEVVWRGPVQAFSTAAGRVGVAEV